jgi:hypothetical protein
MKRYVIALVISLTACSERSTGSNFGFLDDYRNLDLVYKNDPENLNTDQQTDTPEHLDPYSGEKWADDSKAPPKRKPFKLDTFHGDGNAFNAGNVPLNKVREIDNDVLFSEILKCYPAETLFDGELKFQATASPIKSRDRDYDNYYAKVVWEMPLYSSAEVTRRLDRENQRRQTTAQILGNFSEALARKNQALRLVSLYRSLEKRAQERVLQGLTGTEEQIGYLEKTADAHSQLLRAKADVMQYRLQLVSLCTDQKAPKLNEFLKKISGD